MLIVPNHLNRNAKGVRDLGSAEDTGLMLINYMCERAGLDSLAGLDILDLGCGVRFSQTIINRGIQVGKYVGIEVEKSIIDFLTENVDDDRFSYHYINTVNQFYNPAGERLRQDEFLPSKENMFDIACMFSVITHQNPDEAIAIFKWIRGRIKSSGQLFFSAFIHQDETINYQELSPESPGHRSSYSQSYLTEILNDHGWQVESVVEPRPNGIPIMSSLLCSPI